MQRKAMLTGLLASVLLASLATFTQCRAGLFDGWFKKDAELFNKTPRRMPEKSCRFGYNRTSWRPWGTCCETAVPGYTSQPWSDGMVLPETYGPAPSTMPADVDHYPSNTNEVDSLLSPEFPPIEEPVPSGDLVLPPAGTAPLDAVSEDAVPAPSSLPAAVGPAGEGVPTLHDAAPTNLTSPESLLPPAVPGTPLPPVTPPASSSGVPLPTPSDLPAPVGDSQTMRVPPNWQPISYSRQSLRQRPQPQPIRPQSRPSASQWRVMPGYYQPQRPTSAADRMTNVRSPRR